MRSTNFSSSENGAPSPSFPVDISEHGADTSLTVSPSFPPPPSRHAQSARNPNRTEGETLDKRQLAEVPVANKKQENHICFFSPHGIKDFDDHDEQPVPPPASTENSQRSRATTTGKDDVEKKGSRSQPLDCKSKIADKDVPTASEFAFARGSASSEVLFPSGSFRKEDSLKYASIKQYSMDLEIPWKFPPKLSTQMNGQSLTNPLPSPLPLNAQLASLRQAELRENTLEEGKQKSKGGGTELIPFSNSSPEHDSGYDSPRRPVRQHKLRCAPTPQQRWQVAPSKKTSYYFSWDGVKKSHWYDEKVQGEEGYVHDPALTLVLLEPPPFSDEDDEDDDGAEMRGDGGFSHLIQTADASYVAYFKYLKYQRQVEKQRKNMENEMEWQLVRQMKKVLAKMRQTCAQWTWNQIIWIIFLLALVTVGNFLQIIMLNFWLVSFPPEVKGSNYVVFALPGILFFMFFAATQVAHFLRFRPSMSFAKSSSGMALLFGIGFMDAVNSWLAAYAASFTSEVLQALFMNLSPIYAVFMSKLILRDDRQYMNRFIVAVFLLTVSGVLSVTVYSFGISSSIGHVFWILIFFASIPLRVLMNVWQSLYMIVYTYDSTFNEWLERRYIEEVVENAIRLQQGDSALSKKVMRRRRKKVLSQKKKRNNAEQVSSGKDSHYGIASGSSSSLRHSGANEKQKSEEYAHVSAEAGLPVSGSVPTVASAILSPTGSSSHLVGEATRGIGDPFSTVFSTNFPMDVHSEVVLPVEVVQKSASVPFMKGNEAASQSSSSHHVLAGGSGRVRGSKSFPVSRKTGSIILPSPSWSEIPRNEEDGIGEDLPIPVPLHASPPSLKARPHYSNCDGVAPPDNGDTLAENWKNNLLQSKSRQEYMSSRVEGSSTDKLLFGNSDEDRKEVKQSNQGEDMGDDNAESEYEENEDGTFLFTADSLGGREESQKDYYRELEPDEILQVLRSGAGEVIQKGKDRELLLEAEGSDEYRKDLEESHDLKYTFRGKANQPLRVPLPQQSHNIGIGTGINLGGRRKSRKYNPEIHYSPYQEHYRSLQDREGDDLSVKVFMLFSDTFWQLCVSLALLPADALPWFGNSPSVGVTWANFSEGVTYVFTKKKNAAYGILYTLGFVFNYLGAAYLNHYSVALCSIVTQLSSPITALILVIIPSWNKNEDSTPPWYLSLVSIFLLSVASLIYVLWEEKTDDEKKEAEMQLKRYKLKL